MMFSLRKNKEEELTTFTEEEMCWLVMLAGVLAKDQSALVNRFPDQVKAVCFKAASITTIGEDKQATVKSFYIKN